METFKEIVFAPGRVWYLESSTQVPQIPLKGRAGGQPAKWVIDSAHQCWWTSEGVNLRVISKMGLIESLANHPDQERVGAILSSEIVSQPVWAKQALAMGWKPPIE